MKLTYDDIELLESAASELAKFIDSHNDEIKKKITNQTESEPDYYDAQTCQELMDLANRIHASI